MQTSQRAGAGRIRLVILDKATTDAEILQALLMKGFAEPAARIKMALGRGKPGQVGRIQGRGAHDRRPCCSIEVVSNKIWDNAYSIPQLTRLDARAQSAASASSIYDVAGAERHRSGWPSYRDRQDAYYCRCCRS